MYCGGMGVEIDFEKAASYYFKAANQGNAKALCELGTLYLDGRGVDQMPEQAARYYELACKKGYAPAQFNYAALLESGEGVEEKDLTEALRYYKLAAEQGCANSQHQVFKLSALLEHRLGATPPGFQRAKSWSGPI